MTIELPTDVRERRCVQRLVRSRWNHYGVWRRVMADAMCRPGQWLRTSHTIKARTITEANNKLRRMFAGAGFHSMSLIAVPSGETPNAEPSDRQ